MSTTGQPPDSPSDPIESDPNSDITQWLQSLDVPSTASTALFERLYSEIKRAARSQLRRERPEHTLSATALSHEAWLRMNEQTRTVWTSRGHFLAMAATMMRRILVNHELARRADKRLADLQPLTLSGLGGASGVSGAEDQPDVVAVHDALLAFEQMDARAAKVVELKFFGGLDYDEIAQTLDISVATVKRDWTLAKAWLKRELTV